MRDYLKRLLIAGLMALCVSLLFLGGKHSQAAGLDISEATKDWVWPSNGTITDMYGTRNGEHKGIDIAAKYGSPIYTVDSGEVVKSYYSGSYGNVIFIKHDNDTETVYAHLKKRLVTEGQKVNQGDLIGEMGNTGDSSGVHLHFEVHKHKWTFDKKNAINPIFALGEGKIGQTVYALHKKNHKNDVIEVAARPQMPEVDGTIDIEMENTSEKKNDDNLLVHMVKQGETLWSISQKFNTTVDELKINNKLTNNEIKANQELIIKGNKNNAQYIVQQGDTLMSIARKTNVPVKKIMDLNRLKNDLIKPNDVLNLQ